MIGVILYIKGERKDEEFVVLQYLSRQSRAQFRVAFFLIPLINSRITSSTFLR